MNLQTQHPQFTLSTRAYFGACALGLALVLAGPGCGAGRIDDSEELGTGTGATGDDDPGDPGDGDGDPGDGDGDPPCAQQVIETMHPEVGSRWECALSTDLAVDFDVQIGDQVRIRPDDDGRDVLFTVTYISEDDPPGTVGLTSAGLQRLERDAAFCGGVTTRIAPVDMDAEQAEAKFEFIEERWGDFGLADILFLGPHGGDIEFGTDLIVERLRDEFWPGVPLTWICRGWDFPDGLGAFVRWHVSSDVISPRSFPKWGELQGLLFERVVSFHGHAGPLSSCGFAEDVVVGGGAPDDLLDSVRDALADSLDAYTVNIVDKGEKCTGTSSTNIVNSLSLCGGVQIELSYGLRTDAEAREEVAQVVAETMSAWTGCP